MAAILKVCMHKFACTNVTRKSKKIKNGHRHLAAERLKISGIVIKSYLPVATINMFKRLKYTFFVLYKSIEHPMLKKVQKWRDDHETCMQYVESFLNFDSETMFF